MKKKIKLTLTALLVVVLLATLIPVNAMNLEDETNAEEEYETLDNKSEILTFIDASCPKVEIKGFGIIREAELIIDEHFILSYIRLHGFEKPLFYNMDWNIFHAETTYVKIPNFIGYKIIQRGGGGRIDYFCIGIALGNIEWSENSL